ncbi:metallophosphoesterase [Thermaerobacter sp. PB12/4term]|uniref:metallophosphoesterase family protein n=1 Tax=Thermaerobacter sp. PB12/4term TaxID=2293838 RepID=UPI000E32AC43|nr:metallophosphoesterase [Thermaerobacter sp. PB12/4term]QIA27009.1 metallophosphoesterase [Thermaerobacter sp. PB12/4term]
MPGTEGHSPRPAPLRVLRLWQRRLVLILAAAAAAYLAMVAGSPARVSLGPFGVALAARPAWQGLTEVAIPPLGRVRAATHAAPLELEVRLETVDIPTLGRLLEHRGTRGLVDSLRQQVGGVARRFALRLVLLGALGGGLAGFVLARRRWRRIGVGAAVGLLVGGGLVVATQQTYDPGAFRQAEYSGAITAAPWLLDVFTRTPAKVEAFSRQMEVLVGRLNDLYQGIEVQQAVVPQDESLRVLIVSDLHNNPAGVRLIREMAASFRPDLILDAGDVADWGTAPEARLVAELADLEVPYYLVPGNHDSPQSLGALATQTGVQILEDGLVTLPGGLLLAASRDPASHRVSPAMGRPAEIEAQVGALESLLQAAPRRPDILVVHNPVVAGRFRGRVPVLVSGHTHVQRVDDTPQGLFLNPGSTGAAGLRGLTAPREIPYGLLLLTLVPAPGDAPGWVPIAVDAVEVFRLASTGFTLQRYVVDGRPDAPVSFRERPSLPLEELPAGGGDGP